MRKIVLTFGLIAGVILSAMMVISLSFHDAIGFDRAEIIGYTSMVVSFLLIFFGVRTYRDNVAGGTIGFGRAFKVGALIGIIASLCYVVTWEVVDSRIAPDYLAKYQAHELAEARADGATEEEIAKKKAEFDKFATWYKNPALKAAMTFMEPLPVALVISLISAGVLSRRRKGGVKDTLARA
jgi:hypothetical protein